VRYCPDVVLVTGITPPNARTLMTLRSMGICCLNYLTDDPWNASQRAPWFFDAIPHYTHIFSPRQSNLADLAGAGGTVSYLPFAYSPTIHYRESAPASTARQFECDVLFYGGADRDRVPYIKALIDAGLQVHLYGGYWGRDAKTRGAALGMADAGTLRWAISGARVTLCLVRRANRDGHVMRTYEAPAMGACLLAEDTEEQRAILNDTALYFRSTEDLLASANRLLQEAPLRVQLAQRAEQHIVGGRNTYLDRLQTMISNH
jgi:spore maturation protein CgeB